MTEPEGRVFVLRLRAPRDGAIRKLRWLLKRLLRSYDLKCIDIAEESATPLVPIINRGRCAGYLMKRGREDIEAFDRGGRSLGLFANPIAAATAVEAASAGAGIISTETGCTRL
jgi:hypothetical protein